jgi:hypothetical protein
MLRHVALVRTDVSKELSASIIRVTRIGELRTLAATSKRRKLQRNMKYYKVQNTTTDFAFLRSFSLLLVSANVVPSLPILFTLMVEELSSSETSVLTRATWRNIQENGILHSPRRENLKLYTDNMLKYRSCNI